MFLKYLLISKTVKMKKNKISVVKNIIKKPFNIILKMMIRKMMMTVIKTMKKVMINEILNEMIKTIKTMIQVLKMIIINKISLGEIILTSKYNQRSFRSIIKAIFK